MSQSETLSRDLLRLREVAEAAEPPEQLGERLRTYHERQWEFEARATPEAVLALIERLEIAERRVAAGLRMADRWDRPAEAPSIYREVRRRHASDLRDALRA